MEETWEYSVVNPNTYANMWKLIGVLGIVGFAAWLFWPAKERGQVYRAFNWMWVTEAHSWDELDGAYRLDIELSPINTRSKRARIRFNEETWLGLCGAILTSLPESPFNDLSRENVYRVSINVRKPEGGYVLPRAVPISIQNGSCLGASNGAFRFRYPNELSGWDFKRYEISRKFALFGSKGGSELEVVFVWAREGKGDLASFPFQKACDAILSDTPIELQKYLRPETENKARPDRMLVKAEREVGGVFLHAGTYQEMAFNIVGNICVPEESGEPT